MVLEPALDGRDILASAPTGTGKTAAFLLPAMQHPLDFPRRKPGPCRADPDSDPRARAAGECSRQGPGGAHPSLSIETIIGGVSHEEQRLP
jgi:ATP-dependent RNA helicase SrmB